MSLTSRPLQVRFHEGDAISEELVRELWLLRTSMLTLNHSEAEDWAYFSEFVMGPQRCVFVFTDPQGRARGFFTIAFMPFEMGTSRALLMYSKYFYFHRDYRGHPKTMMAPWLLLPYCLQRYGLRSLHFVTTAFPQSYVSLWRSSGRLYSLLDQDTPLHKAAAIRAFAQRFCGSAFDDGTGLVQGNTVADSESTPRSAEAVALHERYEGLNPRWREGKALPVLFSLDGRLVFHNLRRMGRRVVAQR
jgi:hypothetical protein